MVELSRDVQAVQIPDGSPVILPSGTDVRVAQALGGFYTVAVLDGKYRVAGSDGDALGEKVIEPAVHADDVEPTKDSIEKAAWKSLTQVFDPEIPVDVVNLGLVHEVIVEEEESKFNIHVKMGLTAPGCGMGDVLVRDAEFVIGRLPHVGTAKAEVVLFPVWNPSMMSQAAKLKLGMM